MSTAEDIRNHFIDFFESFFFVVIVGVFVVAIGFLFVLFCLPVMFGSMLGPWTLQPLGPDHSGSARCGLPLKVWASNCICHWLAIPKSSVPPLDEHILQAG